MASPIPNQLSPGVNVSEIDLSTFVQPQAFNSGGMAGVFNWGPCSIATRVSSESQLANIFGKPTLDQNDTTNNADFLAASNFLRYSQNLKVVRVLQEDDYNATSVDPGITWIFSTSNPTVKNDDEFRALGGFSGSDGIEPTAFFKARCPGNFGNSLRVLMFDGISGGTLSSANGGGYQDFVVAGGYNPITAAGFSSGTVGYTYGIYVSEGDQTGGGAGGGNITISRLVGVSFQSMPWYMVTIMPPTGLTPRLFITTMPNGSQFSVLYATGTTTDNFNLTASGGNPDGNQANYYQVENFAGAGTLTNYESTTQQIKPAQPFTTYGLGTSSFAVSSTSGAVDILFVDGDTTTVQTKNRRGNTFDAVGNTYTLFKTDPNTGVTSAWTGSETILYTSVDSVIDPVSGEPLPLVSGLPTSFGENASPASSAYSIFNPFAQPATTSTNSLLERLFINFNYQFLATGQSTTGGVRGPAQILGLTGGRTFRKSLNDAGSFETVGITFDSQSGITGIKNNLKFGIVQFGNKSGTSYVETADSFTPVAIFKQQPFTSAYAEALGGANDELSFAVIDSDGKFGPKNGVLERFELLSKATDAKSIDGNSIFYKDYINNNSQYVYLTKPFGFSGGGTSTSTSETAFGDITSAYKPQPAGPTYTRVGYYDNQMQFGQLIGTTPTSGELLSAYSVFADDDSAVDVVFVPESSNTDDASTDSTTIEGLIYDSVIAPRKDTLYVLPTPKPANLNQHSSAAASKAVSYRNSKLNVPTNSYTMVVAGRKVFYDTFNNQTRKMSLSSDLAGILCAQEIAWESPAGFARGMLKNVIKLETKFSKTDRDELYKNQINFFTQFDDGSGTVLFGDKTMLTKPSAFDRINVRRVFIACEKAIAKAAKYSLFEFNDEFTRAQFRNLVTPFLRAVQSQRGIIDYKVVCDNTNNTGEVIDKNQFVADIYIKPSKSVNFIQLNFIAVKSDFTISITE
jgi:hypothetical protein